MRRLWDFGLGLRNCRTYGRECFSLFLLRLEQCIRNILGRVTGLTCNNQVFFVRLNNCRHHYVVGIDACGEFLKLLGNFQRSGLDAVWAGIQLNVVLH